MADNPDFHHRSREVAKTVDRCIYRGFEDEVTDAYDAALLKAYADGERSMQKRAAHNVQTHPGAGLEGMAQFARDLIAERIRALPIEAEER